jgi:O-antigen ligase
VESPRAFLGTDRRVPLRELALGGFALALLAAFAVEGPFGVLGYAAVGLTLGVATVFAPPALRIWAAPLLAASSLVGPLGRGYYVFEPIAWMLAAVAFAQTVALGRREAWDVRMPGLFAGLFLAIPLIAVPTHVVSIVSFIGNYKLYIVWVLLFLALRRIVPREHSQVLLWAFPIVGLIAGVQLLQKTAGLGALLFARLGFRNFYTRLAWGQSDYISAVLEFCLCMTIVLWFLDRRPGARALLAVSAVVMAQCFLLLFSRAGAVGLAVFALVMALGLGGRRGVLALASAAILVVGGMLTPGGQVFLHRFTDPTEYASWYYRIVIWEAAWHRFLTHPWTGIGLNQGRYQHDEQRAEPASNLFLEKMGEEGVLGGLLLAALLFAVFRLAARVDPSGEVDPSRRRVVQMAVIGSVAQVVTHASVEPTITGPQIAILFTLLLVWLCLNDPRGRTASV